MAEKNLWLTYDEREKTKMKYVIDTYKDCLDKGKTERECVRVSRQMALEAGYKPLADFIKEGITLLPGDKVYAEYNEKRQEIADFNCRRHENAIENCHAAKNSGTLRTTEPVSVRTGTPDGNPAYHHVQRFEWAKPFHHPAHAAKALRGPGYHHSGIFRF